MNNLQDRVEDAVESGIHSSRTKIYKLLSDQIAIISEYYAIPVDELLKVVEDGLRDEE